MIFFQIPSWYNFEKYVCLIFDPFQIGALSVMGVGIWTAVDKSYLEILMRNELYMSAAWVLVAVGAITIILSLIGCTGSLTVGNII